MLEIRQTWVRVLPLLVVNSVLIFSICKIGAIKLPCRPHRVEQKIKDNGETAPSCKALYMEFRPQQGMEEKQAP